METKYELLTLDVWEKNFQDFSKCEGLWEECDQENILHAIEISKKAIELSGECVDEHLEDAPYQLAQGRTIPVPIISAFVRVKNELPKCPLCGSSYQSQQEALSRRDNQMIICSECGIKEALEDFFL